MRIQWVRCLSTYVSRAPIQRKSIGAMADSQQNLLFGDRYTRKQSLDPKPSKLKPANSLPVVSTAELESALEDLKKMDSSAANSISSVALLLRKCTISRNLDIGLRIHEEMKRLALLGNVFLSNLLIHMYGKCSDLQSARVVFDSLSEKNKYTWSIMVAAYAQNGHNLEALDLYEKMTSEGVEIDDVLLATVIGICAQLGDLESGKKIHLRVLTSNLIVDTALINMYGKCRRVDLAKLVFDRMVEKDAVAWNAMLAAYAQNVHFASDALKLFKQMIEERTVKPDSFTYSSVLSACANAGLIERGREIHLMILKSGMKLDIALENTLLNMYAKCRCLDEAKRMFEGMGRKSLISWTTMVSAYTQNGHYQEALDLFKRMLSESNLKPNCITYANAISACAYLGNLTDGRAIHERIVHENWHTAAVVGSSLIFMYAKCSCLEEARMVFDKLPHRDVVCTNTMIAAYAQYGHLQEAVGVYREMALDGTDPTEITLISLIIGASHAGRVEDGRTHYLDVVGDFNSICVLWEHYMCLVDLLARSGWLADAEELVETMPFEPCVNGWITLLSACRIHGDVDRAERAAERVAELEPGGAEAVLMLGACKGAQTWDLMSMLRRRM